MTDNEIKSQLCHYDENNPYNILSLFEGDDRPQPRNVCVCDNCFYERDKLAVQILETQRERDAAREQLAAERLQIKALHDRLDNALSDAKQADADSIRALGERNEAREQLAAERALADRLAMTLGTFCGGTSSASYAAWKQARTPTEKKFDFS